MAQIISPFSFRQVVSFSHEFQRVGESRGCGYSFDANEDGTLNHDDAPQFAKFREANFAEVQKDRARGR